MANEFRWNVWLRIACIIALSLMLAWILVNREWFFTPLVIGIVLGVIAWDLVRYIERTNKDLTYFILSIKQHGFTTSFPDTRRGRTFKRLAEAFNDVIEEFQKINLQRETHYQYLQLLTDQLAAGILSFDEKGKVHLMNPAAKQILQIIRLENIESIREVNLKLYQAIHNLQAGERQLSRLIIGDKETYLSIQSREIVMNDETFKIVLLQDLNSELEDREVDAWQKLTRVLTHEIMNSVTPIVTLSEAVHALLTQADGQRKPLQQLDEDDRDDLFSSVETIESRSRGLLRFVNAYKDFTKTPEVRFSNLDVVESVTRVVRLLLPDFESKQIKVDVESVHETVYANGDAEWLEQVWINLLKNAKEAVEGAAGGRVHVEIGQRGGKTFVTIADNGAGMSQETLDKIFVPFFTTKQNGTGVGLSLSRQIMRQHNGKLTINSQPGKGTVVQVMW